MSLGRMVGQLVRTGRQEGRNAKTAEMEVNEEGAGGEGENGLASVIQLMSNLNEN